MSRATTGTQENGLVALRREDFLWVEIKDADANWVEMTNLAGHDWVIEVVVDWNADEPVSSARIVLAREQPHRDPTETDILSIAPFITGSVLNRDHTNTYAPLAHFHRDVRIYVATVPLGTTRQAALAHRALLWRGRTDTVAWGGSTVTLSARDPGGVLVDKYVETEMTLGNDASPVAVATVMQTILDTQFGAGVYPLAVVGTPDFGVREYKLLNVTVMEALLKLADLFGWNLHHLWNASANDFRLTLYEPKPITASWTRALSSDDYYVVPDIKLDGAQTRNAGELIYADTAGAKQTVTITRTGGSSALTRRFIRLDETGGVIRTNAEATRMLTAVMNQLEVAEAVQQVEAALFWPIEIADVLKFTANGVHYDEDQFFTVFALTHTFNQSTRSTTITASGAPSGGYMRWLGRTSQSVTVSQPTLITPTHSESGTTGTFGITVWDPSDVAFDLRYRTKSGASAFTAIDPSGWDQKTATPEHNEPYTQTVTLVLGHPSTVEFRLAYSWNGTTQYVYAQSAPFDYGQEADITNLDYRFENNRLHVSVIADADTRTTGGVSVIGKAGSAPADPVLAGAAYQFSLSNARSGEINTGIDVANPGANQTTQGKIKVRGINAAGIEGPVREMTYVRIGTATTSVTINSFSADSITNGSGCGAKDSCLVSWNVTATGHTVDVKRYISTEGSDFGAPTTVVSGSTNMNSSHTDSLPFFQDEPAVSPIKTVQYQLLVKDGGGAVVVSAWSEARNTLFGVQDCG